MDNAGESFNRLQVRKFRKILVDMYNTSNSIAESISKTSFNIFFIFSVIVTN